MKMKTDSSRVISHVAIRLGTLAALLAAIWSPEDAYKWIATSLYVHMAGRYFGLTIYNEKIKGSKIIRKDVLITDFLPMKTRPQ
jgi:hypothetical protein